MWLVFLCTSLVQLALAIDQNEACLFLGARFARVASGCNIVTDFCDGIFRSNSGRYTGVRGADTEMVKCNIAVEEVGAFLSEYSVNAVLVDAAKTEQLFAFLEGRALECLRTVSFGSAEAVRFVPGLGGFDLAALRAMAADPVAWRETIVPRMLESSIPPLVDYVRKIIVSTLLAPLSYAPMRSFQQAAVHFYFDLSALLGIHLLSAEMLSLATLAIERSVPEYRMLTSRDGSAREAREGVPLDVAGIVAVSSAIDRLSKLSDFIKSSDLELVYSLLAGWTLSPESAAKELLGDQLLMSFCPTLLHQMTALQSTIPSSYKLRRLGVSLIDFCGPVTLRVDLMKSRDMLARWEAGNVEGLRVPEDAISFLSDDSLPWSLGWNLSLPKVVRKTTTLTILNEFIEQRVDFIDRSKAGMKRVSMLPLFGSLKNARAFGRGLGLAILNRVGFHDLKISQSFAALLHPRVRLNYPFGILGAQAAIAPTKIEFLLAVSRGLGDTLGPGGFEMFSTADWLALFGRSRPLS